MVGTGRTTLNDAQRRAAEFGSPGDGVPRGLLVIAGAGTGKTATLAHRVAVLVAAGIDPARILLLTFTSPAGMRAARAS